MRNTMRSLAVGFIAILVFTGCKSDKKSSPSEIVQGSYTCTFTIDDDESPYLSPNPVDVKIVPKGNDAADIIFSNGMNIHFSNVQLYKQSNFINITYTGGSQLTGIGYTAVTLRGSVINETMLSLTLGLSGSSNKTFKCEVEGRKN